jgi:hypothetical protein
VTPGQPGAGDERPDRQPSLSELADRIRQQKPWLAPGEEERRRRRAEEARRVEDEARRAREKARAGTWSLQHPGGVATLDDLVPGPWKPARDLLRECYDLLTAGHSQGEPIDVGRSVTALFHPRRGWRIDFGVSPEQSRSSKSGVEHWHETYYVYMLVDRRLVIPAALGFHGRRPARLSQFETWAFLAKGHRIQGGGALEDVQTLEKLRKCCAEVIARSVNES